MGLPFNHLLDVQAETQNASPKQTELNSRVTSDTNWPTTTQQALLQQALLQQVVPRHRPSQRVPRLP